MGEAVTVSIVIRTYNEAANLARLLEGIAQQQASFRFETVLVDSGSTDDTVAIALRHGARVVHILPDEFSFGYSLNRGIEAAQGEFCVLVSGHCYPVDPHWLHHLITPFVDPTVAVVYGKQRGADTTRYSEHQIFQQWFPDEAPGKQSLAFCNNANCAIRRALWLERRYDESITGLEDLEWAGCMTRRGFSVYYAPDAGVIHLHNETYWQIFRRYEREALALHAMYPHSSFSFVDFLKLFSLNVASDCCHAVREGAFLRNVFGIAAMRLCQFWGTYKGHNYLDAVSQELKYKFYYPKKPGIYSRWEKLKDGRVAPKQNA